LGMGDIAQWNNPGAPLFIAGQFPGEEEDKIGLPMQGKGGQWTEWALTRVAGIPWSYGFYTNILACKPPNGKAKAKFVKTCAERVYEALEIVQPKLIVSMGLVAGKFFVSSNKAKMSELAGTDRMFKFRAWSDPKIISIPIVFVTHPFEPARQNSVYAKKTSEARVTHDFQFLKNKCVEMGLLERIPE